MSHLKDYQTAEIKELFNCDLIRETIDTYDSLTEQEEAVLRFIGNNPSTQYIKLQNTFTMPDHLVVDLVLNYGASSEEYDELRSLKDKMRRDYKNGE